MAKDSFMVGAGAGIAGLLLGIAVGGDDLGGVETRLKRMETGAGEASSAAAETLGALEARLDGIEATLGQNAEAAASGAAGLSDKIDTLSASVEAMDAALAEQGTAAAAEMARVEAALDGQLDEMRAAVAEAKAGTAAPAAAPSDEDAAAPAIAGAKAGQTQMLMDGKIRVFVSGVDTDAGTARVAVNGFSLVELGNYRDVVVSVDGEDCVLNLDGIVEGHAQMSAACAD